MFGFKHIQFDSMTYVLYYKNGELTKEGRGLSFFYFAPNSSIIAIPMGSNDLPFIFNESTNDYQTISIQGQITYKIKDPRGLADVLDFTITRSGNYKKNDIEKLNQRIINEAQTSTSTFIHQIGLKDAIRSAKEIENKIIEGLKSSDAITMLGIEILGANVVAVQATPEMAKALETETRERLQQEADQAIYERRNFAVEQERKIRESEMNTEIAVEEKQKQIDEKRMESEVQRMQNKSKLRQMSVEADIEIEEQRKILIEQKSANEKKEADIQGYKMEVILKPYRDTDWRTLTALSSNSDPGNNIALAFRELAQQAEKIGTLNISPDLLETLLKGNNKRTQKS